ncbi:MAG: 16S rRNA (cytidine(1402)-2'-O)-methyltransferase [Candidatus Eremiobacteraeota bacterium]|nr:16S rRNA (cytidine(1402)-2'-O)-methyltransferase [Candidatus Eremiobacteraeota bacterium]MBC5827800.1 16S rRNA (cytidine(1402)-2'-O)-methyltransferase [Candidatus Eremiobacteraeota bacterium]
MQGRLVLCPTPLGNLADITLRVLGALRSCDVIFVEDTRVSGPLLRHYEIDKPMRSYHAKVEPVRLRELRALMAQGKTVAAVTDAGMPGISDPGRELVRLARECGAAVECLPGPAAFTGAIVLSGFDVSRFRFEGFPPRKPGARRAYLSALRAETAAVAWYEAPSRVSALLTDIAAVLPGRTVFALREYTKKFEQQALGTPTEVSRQIGPEPRGEFVIVLEGASPKRPNDDLPEAVKAALSVLIAHDVSIKAAVEAMRAVSGLPRNLLYETAQRLKSR